MPTIAAEVLDWLVANPSTSASKRAELMKDVPAHQWALPGGHWSDLAMHCGNRRDVPQEVRFMNRLSINLMTPLPRCLYRSPDGRGLAWLKSGGEVLAYGLCEQVHCEHAKLPGQSS